MSTRGIIIATFGSIYGEAVEASIGAMETAIHQAYPTARVFRVFLSEALVTKWNDKYESRVYTLHEALMECKQQGITEVCVQPLALVADQCYQQMRRQLHKGMNDGTYDFEHLSVGRQLLSSLGVKNYTDDYEATLEAIVRHINTKALNKSILLMANGQNQLEYSALQLKALYGVAPNVAVFTSNGFPNFKQSLTTLERMGHTDVIVVPLAFIGSSHLMDYLGGDRPDSISALLGEKGYSVTVWNEGLGENPYIQDLVLRRVAYMIRSVEKKQAARPQNVRMTDYEKIS